jgi:hypothetical protein
MRTAAVILTLVALAACRQAEPDRGARAQPTVTPSAAPAVARAEPASAAAVKVSEETKTYSFDYSYPAQAAALPGLKAWLDADLAKQRQATVEGGRETVQMAKEMGEDAPSWTQVHSTDWAVVAELPGWISLSAEHYEFSGGAHGNPYRSGLLWDKAANAVRDPRDLFTAPAALSEAIRARFCAELNQQRAEKRGEPIRPDSEDPFDECIDPVKSTLILGSADRQRFTRIGVLVDPYEAGPYVEGFYEVTLPVNDAVLKAVRPQYRQFFAPGR